jgi:hypothetical protein
MCKSKAFERSIDFVTRDGEKACVWWVEDENGKHIGYKYCDDCGEALWSGHVVNDGDEHYCECCMKKRFTEEQMSEMYENDEQYYTEWDLCDIEDDYEVVKEGEEVK